MKSFSNDPMLSPSALDPVYSPSSSPSAGAMFARELTTELSHLATVLLDDNEGDYDYYDNSSENYRPVSARVETFVMSAVLGLIFIVGVLGNGTLIAIFLRHRGMRNIPNT